MKTREPYSREQKLKDALTKRLDNYVKKHGEYDKTYEEVGQVLLQVTKEYVQRVKLFKYTNHK